MVVSRCQVPACFAGISVAKLRQSDTKIWEFSAADSGYQQTSMSGDDGFPQTYLQE